LFYGLTEALDLRQQSGLPAVFVRHQRQTPAV
jgi:aspartate aminotransferase-like enzyme